MYKLLGIKILLFSVVLMLSACYTKHSQQLSLKAQCLNLKREQLFLESGHHRIESWQIDMRRMILQKEYQKYGCYRILSEKQTPSKRSHKTDIIEGVQTPSKND